MGLPSDFVKSRRPPVLFTTLQREHRHFRGAAATQQPLDGTLVVEDGEPDCTLRDLVADFGADGQLGFAVGDADFRAVLLEREGDESGERVWSRRQA